MLAKRRNIRLNGQEVARTPLLIPSFSSKGFPDVKDIIAFGSEFITDVALISAYDLHHNLVSGPIDFPELVFLDSGGYEASKDVELSEVLDGVHKPEPWTRAMHEAQLEKWVSRAPTVLISFDSPGEKVSLDVQIERANSMAPSQSGCLREILLKPETTNQVRLQMEEIVKQIHKLADFDIIGVTEKEVGNSVTDRMKNIARLRRALQKAGLETPIHVFGSLDTISTPLYFLAGADIFDGLTWLRYAYHEGYTIYRQNFGALHLGVTVKSNMVNPRCWSANYQYMKNMEAEMRRFLKSGDYKTFQHHSELFRKAMETVLEELGD